MYSNFRKLHSDSIQNRNLIFHHAGLFDKYAEPCVFKEESTQKIRGTNIWEMDLLFCAGLQAILKLVIDLLFQ